MDAIVKMGMSWKGWWKEGIAAEGTLLCCSHTVYLQKGERVMFQGDFPSRAALWRRKSTWITIAGGLLACVVWVLPNWTLFWAHVSQFPALWQISSNRIIIVYLFIKILSPLLIMGLLTLLLRIYSCMQEETESVDVPDQVAQSPGLTTAPVSQKSQALPFALVRASTESTAARSQPIQAVRRVVDPVTPLPPVMPTAEALQAQLPSGSLTAQPLALHPPLEMGARARVDKREQSAQSSSSLSFALVQPVVNERPHIISIHLLKDVTLAICVPGGGRVIVPLTLNAKRVQLLAYIAWRHGEMIDRDKILEHIFGWGVSDEEATEDKLSERFESHKKLLRRKIREIVAEQVNKPAGKELIDPDIDPFMSDAGFWGLSDICRVEDLEELERCNKVISVARKDGKLIDEIPEFVKDACDRLIANYSGDFLETMIKKFPGEFRAWQGRSSWARKPYTLYRDYYLDALWYAAEYEWRMGQRYAEDESPTTKEMSQRKQEYYGRAAQKYQSYAMYACNSRFDAKAIFGAHGEYGERVGMSERALRRCIVLLGAIGRTDQVNQVWSAYLTQMKSVSDQRWQPSQATQADVDAARSQTSAYRFAAQVSQMSSEFADRIS